MSDQAAQDDDLSALEALVGDDPPETPEAPPETPEAEETQPEASQEADPQVEKASAKGWKPLEEFDGDESEWVDAGEFLRRQPLFDQIRSERRKREDLEKKLESTTKFVKGIEERVRNQTLAEIEAERRKAVEDGDVEAFEEADKKYQEAAKPTEQPAEEASDELPQEVQDFASRNAAWFEKNAAMTEDAVAFTKFYRGKGMELDAALVEAEKDIKTKYPAFFTNPNRKRPQTVSEGNREKGQKVVGYNDLTAEQKTVYASIKGHMSLDEYIKELKEQGAFDE